MKIYIKKKKKWPLCGHLPIDIRVIWNFGNTLTVTKNVTRKNHIHHYKKTFKLHFESKMYTEDINCLNRTKIKIVTEAKILNIFFFFNKNFLSFKFDVHRKNKTI